MVSCKDGFPVLRQSQKEYFLMIGSAWCLVMVQIQFSLIKKKMDVQNAC